MLQNKENYEAEKSIQNALLLGSEELSLKDMRLTELPESIGKLKQLKKLYISENELSELPDSIINLTELIELDISHNKYVELPVILRKLKQLQYFKVGENKLIQLPEWISDFSQLVALSCYRCDLTSLPVLSGLRKMKSLNIYGNPLTQLPEWLSDLDHLTSLQIGGIGLEELPLFLRKFKKLEGIRVHNNKLTSIPEWIDELELLSFLDIGENQIKSLPNSISKLKKIKYLSLGNLEIGNEFIELPECIKELKELKRLSASYLGLRSLPDWLGDLGEIETLFLNDNHLIDIPRSLSKLDNLTDLILTNNPLNPELEAAYKQGLEAVKTYLGELAKGSRKRFEAKLLILGDGNEGKTCISRALRGLPFLPQVTTRGVDVEQWEFDHPDYIGDKEKNVTLNIWDFEGQEINHQTHQFFLTTQSLYILVFKCRDQFLMDRAEYWLDTIRARAPKAKVAIVITQSEKRTPYVPADKLQSQYSDVLTEGKWLFAVGCEDNSGIEELKNYLKRWAADLKYMGCEWPQSYSNVETALKEKAKTGVPNIDRKELNSIFYGCNISENSYYEVAASMTRLGVMTQFPDCPDLRNFIILQPQWLTKAISEIMEYKQLAADKGEISLQSMEDIWNEKKYPGLFPTFHNCMKEFELCYDLEDASKSCLVPLRFGYERPHIPWSIDKDAKERLVEYKLNIKTPMGLMSRFIVKTHHMIVKTVEYPKGVYWHNGVFLRIGNGPLTSEALCEFDNDERKLRIHVKAAFPQNMIEQIHAYVKAVFSFFSGLEPERSYGCIKIDDQTEKEEKCKGFHSESRIYSAIFKKRVLDCEHEFHDIDPEKLVWGFSSFGEYILTKVVSVDKLRNELDKKPEWAESLTKDIGTLLYWAEDNQYKMKQLLTGQQNLSAEMKQEMDLKLFEYLGYISQMLDERDHSTAPAIFSINTKDKSKWNPKAYFTKTYVLTPFCECDQNIHICEDGKVEFKQPEEWWKKTAPWIGRGTKVLSVGLQIAFAGMPLTMGPNLFNAIKDDVDFMKELSEHITMIPKVADSNEMEEFEVSIGKRFGREEAEINVMRASLSRMLEAVAPDNFRARQWGSLKRVRMSDNSYRWLCNECAEKQKS